MLSRNSVGTKADPFNGAKPNSSMIWLNWLLLVLSGIVLYLIIDWTTSALVMTWNRLDEWPIRFWHR